MSVTVYIHWYEPNSTLHWWKRLMAIVIRYRCLSMNEWHPCAILMQSVEFWQSRYIAAQLYNFVAHAVCHVTSLLMTLQVTSSQAIPVLPVIFKCLRVVSLQFFFVFFLAFVQCDTLPLHAQSGNQVSTSLGNSGLCWTIFARNRASDMIS